MDFLKSFLVFLVCVEHMFILILEMFLWTKPIGLKTFGLSIEFANDSKVLAANQGLYNGFLAAGLLWGLLHPDVLFGQQIQIFFLCCIIVAAFYGAATSKRSILVIQGSPALIALIFLLLSF